MIYIGKGDEKMVEFLIKAGVDVNARENDDSTPLHAAVWFGTPKIVEMLIKNGAHVNAQDKWKNTPLHRLATFVHFAHHYALAEILLKNGADVNIRNADDKTPLDLARDNNSNINIAITKKSKFIIVFFFSIHFIKSIISILFCSYRTVGK